MNKRYHIIRSLVFNVLFALALELYSTAPVQAQAVQSEQQSEPREEVEEKKSAQTVTGVKPLLFSSPEAVRLWGWKWAAAIETQQASLGSTGPGQGSPSTEELQKAVQNPVASLISVPFQNNIDFGIGPYDRTKNTLNIQPVVPFHLSESVNLITRTIFPVILQPVVNTPNQDVFGLGDVNPTFFFSPAKPGKLIWGIGPAFVLATATDRDLGTGKWSAGPSVVALVQPGKWTIGALASNVWSFAGQENRPAVNSMSLQYFVNHNFSKGWYFASAPIITANWRAADGDKWLVPFGGGFGKVTKFGEAPVNWQITAYYNAIRPDNVPSARWQLRLQLALLYPKKR